MGLLALMLLTPVLFAVGYDEGGRTIAAYGGSALAAAVCAVGLFVLGRGATSELHRKDALGTVALTWLGLGVFGGLPFLIEGSIPNVPGALFEAVSGFTTTGATVVGDVDNLSMATNFWRCFMHWIGGMGIVVLFVAIFPQLGVSAKQLFKSEAPGPVTEGLRPRIKQTAFTLWLIYTALTVLCMLLLWLAGMSPYDALAHAMSTLGTGGFSTRGASIAFYKSALIDWILIVFMLIAALNFGLYYSAMLGNWREIVRNSEVRFYLMLNLVVTGVVTLCILPRHDGVLESVRYAAFQVLAVTTTTGFATEDFDTYPNIARYTLFLCMFIGGCAGSTAGGMKGIRALVLMKLALRELRLVLQPNELVPVRVGRSVYGEAVLHGILVFSVTFLLLWAVGSLGLVALGLDLDSAMSATIACLASVGPGLGDVGPSRNFGFVPGAGKLMLCVLMIAGRLEIFALFAVLHPNCWRRG